MEYSKTEGGYVVGELPKFPKIEYTEYEPRYTGDPWDDREEDVLLSVSRDLVANQAKYRASKAYTDYKSLVSSGRSPQGNLVMIYSFIRESISFLEAQENLQSRSAHYPHSEVELKDGYYLKDYKRLLEAGSWGSSWDKEFKASEYYTKPTYL